MVRPALIATLLVGFGALAHAGPTTKAKPKAAKRRSTFAAYVERAVRPARTPRGSFAAYIDPAAPLDPPLVDIEKSPLSIVFLVDRRDAGPFTGYRWLPVYSLKREIWAMDELGVMSFGSTIDQLVNVTGEDYDQVVDAVRGVPSETVGDLVSGLDAARQWLRKAPAPKVVILLTHAAIQSTTVLEDAIEAYEKEHVRLVVYSLDADPQVHLPKSSAVTHVIEAQSHAVPTDIERELRSLRVSARDVP